MLVPDRGDPMMKTGSSQITNDPLVILVRGLDTARTLQ